MTSGQTQTETGASTPKGAGSIWPAASLLALASGYTIWAQSYGDVSRQFPTLVGFVTALLSALDLVSRLNLPWSRALRVACGADFHAPEMGHTPRLASEFQQVGWIVGCAVVTLAVGILPAAMGFIAIYMRVQGRVSWLRSIGAAAALTASLWLVFEALLDYELFRGVISDPSGVALW